LINTFESLKNKNFRFLVFGMITMIGGMNIQMLARAQLGWDLTSSSFAVTLIGVDLLLQCYYFLYTEELFLIDLIIKI